MKKIAVIALGGNALLRGNEIGTIQQQEKNAYNTFKNLIELIHDGYNIVITHGNGPQVGNILLRNEAGYNTYKIPKMPLDTCVADSQGGIGYMLERQLRNLLAENKIKKNVVTIVTQVLVDKNDTAFQSPNKPIGAFYLKEEADLLAKANNWTFSQDSRKRGWRRVVPSPEPIDILNKKIIKSLVNKGNIVIASGGGGVPVYMENKMLNGADAVIDKDLAASLLATEIDADAFFILTDINKVFINFNKPDQKGLDIINCEQARFYLNKGEFAKGSMGPKILAAIKYTEQSGNPTFISDSNSIIDENNCTKIIK